MLSKTTWPNWHGVPKKGVAEILKARDIPDKEYAFGHTKIFIINPKTVGRGDRILKRCAERLVIQKLTFTVGVRKSYVFTIPHIARDGFAHARRVRDSD